MRNGKVLLHAQVCRGGAPEFSGDPGEEVSGKPRRVVIVVAGDASIRPPARF